jgi:hypothetical protein
MKCPRCPYYEQKTSYGIEYVKCNNDECNNEIEKIADELIFVVKPAAQDYSDEEFGK